MGFGGNGVVVSPWLVPFFWFFLLFNFVSTREKRGGGTYPLDPLLIWRQLWFGGVWMLVFEKQCRYIAWHTDVAVAGSVVTFNVNACKYIAGHVVLHTMEFFEDTEEVVEVFAAHIFNTKVVYDEAKLDGLPFMVPETGC